MENPPVVEVKPEGHVVLCRCGVIRYENAPCWACGARDD